MPMSKKAIKPLLIAVGLGLANPVLAQDILPRSGWGAAEPVLSMQAHRPTRITVHHTAVRQKPGRSIEDKLRSLQAFSQREELLADGRTKMAWADVPYHYYIDASGQIAEGRDVGFVGDTNTRYDPTGHIAVVVEGNFEDEHLGDAQRQSLIALLQLLSKRHKVPLTAIDTHQSFAATACPGQNLAAEFSAILKAVKG